MKKLILGLLTASLLLSPAAAYADTEPLSTAVDSVAAPDTELSLPSVGEVINGFEVKELRDFSDIHGTVVLFEHQRTGAQVMYIATDDTNLSFNLRFNTQAVDNTGLPHIFEHSVLNGSEKYPSKSLFMNLMWQAYVTYMNAYTFDRFTLYPVSSLSEAQLLKLADYYVDTCLHPLVLGDESILREEGWRYRMEDLDSDLTIEGTVYSEESGVITLEETESFHSMATAFPGSVAGNNYGGLPEFIPDLTMESVQAYHKRYYHPSNSTVYLYGKFEDYAAFLKLLDEAYAPYEKQDTQFEDSGYTPITEPVHAEFAYPVEAGSSTENQSCAEYLILLPELKAADPEFLQTAVLAKILNTSSSPLNQKLREALPGGSFSVSLEIDGPEPALLFRAKNINRSEDTVFKETVDQALAELAQTGFSEETAEACQTTRMLSAKLLRDASTPGVNLAESFSNYLPTGNPFQFLEICEAEKQITEWNKEGLFGDLIAKWLLDQPRTSLTTTYPAPGEKEDAELAEKLAGIKASMTEEEKQAIVDATHAQGEVDDASAYVKELQAVTVDTLPDEVPVPEIRDVTDEDGVRHIDLVADLEGIGRPTLYFDSQGLSLEEQLWATLYYDLLGFLPTSEHTKEEIDTLKSRYLYNFNHDTDAYRDGNSFVPKAYIGWTALDEDLDAGYDLCKELLYESDYSAIDWIRQRVDSRKSSIRSSFRSNPIDTMRDRGLGLTDEYDRFKSYVGGISYYEFLEHVSDLLSEEPETVTSRLEQLQHYFHNRTNAIATFVGNAKSIETNRPLADAFLASLDEEPITPQSYEIPSVARREAVIADTGMQHNYIWASTSVLGLDSLDYSYVTIFDYVLDAFLIPQLRVQYGAYSPMAGGRHQTSGYYLGSYQDPNIKETFDVFESLPQQIAEAEIDQDTLDGYILNRYSSFVFSRGVLADAQDLLSFLLNGIQPDYQQTAIQQIKSVTPEKVHESAEFVKKMIDLGTRSTVGMASKIQENKDLYDEILNPFGDTE